MKKLTLLIRMMLIVAWMLSLNLGCSSLNSKNISGSGKLLQVPYEFKDFKRLTFSNLFQVKLSQAANYRIEVTVDDNIEQYLDVTQQGSELRFSLDSGHSFRQITLNVNIAMPDLERLRIEDVSSAEIMNFTVGSALELIVSDTSEVSGTVSGALHCTVSDASDARLSGNGSLELTVDDASDADLSHFQASQAIVSVSDASSAKVNVSTTMQIALRDVATLYYYGNPAITVRENDDTSELKRLGMMP